MDAVEKLYKTRSYWRLYSTDVLLAALPWVLALGVLIYLSYDAILKQARANWKNDRCNPIYLPFAGVIMPQPGKSTSKVTIDNFDYCIRRDLTNVFKVILLPLEFVAFSILSALDLMLEAILRIVEMLEKLRKLIGSIAERIISKIINFIVPIVLFVAKTRDTLAKANAVTLSGIFTTLTMYSMIISGLLSLTTIIVELLIAMTLILIPLFVLAIVLMNPFTFPVGMALMASGMLILTLIFIPCIVIYILLQVFMTALFGDRARPAPRIPFP